MKKSTLTIAAFAAMLTAGVLFSCSKDAEKTEPAGSQQKTYPGSGIWKATKEREVRSVCCQWVRRKPNGDTLCSPIVPYPDENLEICWARISMDPLNPCYEGPIDITLSADFVVDMNDLNWLRSISVESDSVKDASLLSTLERAAVEGSIYLCNGLEVVAGGDVYPVENDYVEPGAYTVTKTNGTFRMEIL